MREPTLLPEATLTVVTEVVADTGSLVTAPTAAGGGSLFVVSGSGCFVVTMGELAVVTETAFSVCLPIVACTKARGLCSGVAFPVLEAAAITEFAFAVLLKAEA